MSYARFGAMIATSTVVMFGLMYLNTYALDHVWFSQTRLWMALLMGAMMAVVMLAFMLRCTGTDGATSPSSPAASWSSPSSLWLVRSQETVGRRLLHEGDDPAPFHRHHDQRTGPHPRSARARTGRRHHRGAGARDRRDGRPDRRPKQNPTPEGAVPTFRRSQRDSSPIPRIRVSPQKGASRRQ